MPADEALPTMVRSAIDTYPPRLTQQRNDTDPADIHRAEAAYQTYLNCIALTLGGHDPTHDQPPTQAATTAWRCLRDALDTILSHAATTEEPDHPAALRAVLILTDTHKLPSRPLSMQQRILTALTSIGQQAGRLVSVQSEYANTGRLYYTTNTPTTVFPHPLIELSYHFDTDRCTLHLHGPAIQALHLHDSPPRYRYHTTPHGPQVSYHSLSYTDTHRVNSLLTLITHALSTTPTQP